MFDFDIYKILYHSLYRIFFFVMIQIPGPAEDIVVDAADAAMHK